MQLWASCILHNTGGAPRIPQTPTRSAGFVLPLRDSSFLPHIRAVHSWPDVASNECLHPPQLRRSAQEHISRRCASPAFSCPPQAAGRAGTPSRQPAHMRPAGLSFPMPGLRQLWHCGRQLFFMCRSANADRQIEICDFFHRRLRSGFSAGVVLSCPTPTLASALQTAARSTRTEWGA
jgi:hypothetical protein